MKLTLKGTVLLNGKFHEFRITVSGSIEACDYIGDILRKKIREKGWMP